MGMRPATFHQNKMDNIRSSAFTLAFESVQADDWVTEKVYHALAVGSVPVYYGASNIEDFLPCRHCIINANRYEDNHLLLAKRLKYLLKNGTAYDEYLSWTKTPYDAA